MKLSAHQEKILKAIPEAQERLGVEWVSAGFLHPHMGRLPQPSAINKLAKLGEIIIDPNNHHQFKAAQ